MKTTGDLTNRRTGVNSISLKYRETQMVDEYGNVFRYKARVNPDDPKESDAGRTAYDVFFVTLDTPSKSSDGGKIVDAVDARRGH